MQLDQTRAPLAEAVRAYRDDDILPFTTPGHKRGRGISPETACLLGAMSFVNDIPVASGVDDTHTTHPVPLAESCGHIAAEVVTPYPPGIPLLAPGERITRPIVEYLQAGLASGMHVTGAADPSLATLCVV